MSGRNLTACGPADVARALTPEGALPRNDAGFSHVALLYDGSDRGLDAAAMLARRAADACVPLHMAVPGAKLGPIRQRMPNPPHASIMADMAELGRNPARLIPAALTFADDHADERVWCLWEPAWPQRSAPELREVTRHEALCNVAFGSRAMTIICLYDTARLPARVISCAEQTHPYLISSDTSRASGAYLGPGRIPPGCDEPLPPPSHDAASMAFTAQLGPVREFSASQAMAAGLDRARVSDLVLAVSEIAANALSHTGDGGVVRSWCTDDEILYQIEDDGYIADPLAGRRRRPADSRGGHGLWLVNRVCDLVEQRTGPAGTITRLHMRLS